MFRRRRTEANLLTYNGAVYQIESNALTDLRARGVVIPDSEQAGAFLVSPSHLFDEVDPYASPIWRRAEFDPRATLMSMLSSHRDGQR